MGVSGHVDPLDGRQQTVAQERDKVALIFIFLPSIFLPVSESGNFRQKDEGQKYDGVSLPVTFVSRLMF